MSRTKAKKTMVKVLKTSHKGFPIHKEIHKKGRKMLKWQSNTPKVVIDNIRTLDYGLVSKVIKPIADIDPIKICTLPNAIAAETEEPQNDLIAKQQQIGDESRSTVENFGENFMNALGDGGTSISATDYYKNLTQISAHFMSYNSKRKVKRIDSGTEVDDGYESDDGLLDFA